MNKPITTLMLLSASASLLFTGCIDNNYDLSDIDTTVKVSVNSLTLPVNIDAITLSSIIDVKEGDKIQIVDGQYALVDDGTFNSSAISINPFTIQAPSIEPSITPINIGNVSIPGVQIKNDITITPELQRMSDYSYSYSGISEDIVDIDRIGLSWNFVYKISFQPEGYPLPDGLKLANIVMQLPKGLVGQPSLGQYNPETGEITIPEVSNLGNGVYLTMTATGLDIKKAGIEFDYPTHSIKIAGQTGVKSLQLVIPAETINSGVNLPTKITLTSQPILGEFKVVTFSGIIKYAIDNLNVNPVNLTDLPDFLNQDGTNIKIANPQIYLNLTNPFAEYGIHGEAGLTLTAIRDNGEQPVVCSIDNGTFEIKALSDANYCLSPEKPLNFYPGFENANPVPFQALSNLLSGNGLPKQIDINLNNPTIPKQTVTEFRLGDYQPIEGKYTIYAPLELESGSQIVYSSTEDGWNDEDVDKITISELVVKATVSTDLPFNVSLSGYPIDINGNQINNVEIDGADINANANSQDVTIRITGTITHLDGIHFEARAAANTNESKPLSPSQNIVLKNIRATVSGYFEKEL